MLSRLLSELIRCVDRGLDVLLTVREAGAGGDENARSAYLRGRELDRFRRVLLRHLLLRLDQPIQQAVLQAERLYVTALRGYFLAIHTALQRHAARNSADADTMAAPNSGMQGKLNYLNLLFNDSPEVVRLLQCFSSMETFEGSLIPFPEPVVRELNRFWPRNSFTIGCDLDERLLDVLTRFQKEDFYPMVVQKLHDNVPVLKVVVGIMLKAIEYHEQPTVILHKLNEIWTDVYDLALNMLYQWLISLSGHDIQAVFGNLLKKFAAFNEQLPLWVNQLREDLLINDHADVPPAEDTTVAPPAATAVAPPKRRRARKRSSSSAFKSTND